MKEFKGTKEDWEVSIDDDYSDTYYIKPSPTFAESRYNAKLIAAAPDLLEALITLHERLVEAKSSNLFAYEAYDSFYQEMTKDVINKALGK